jgi:hypothetical protein
MDWSMLLYLNHSESFLQWMTIVNLMSPLTSLMLPIVLCIFPFLLLKLQQIPIDFNTYIKVLGEIAENHFIGKMVNISSFSFDKIIYLLFTAGMYILQIYQNVNYCFSFHKNMKKINEQLYDMHEYVSTAIHKMELFISHNKHETYAPFVGELEAKMNSLKKLKIELSFFKKRQPNMIFNLHNLGHMLRVYYVLHSNIEYENSLLYSFGFEGYLDNLNSIWMHYKNGKINLTTFVQERTDCEDKKTTTDSEGKLKIKEQYYPPHLNTKYVNNDCNLKDNIIISGVNASGKTTFLKTTTLNILFSQQFGVGFFSSMIMVPYTHIHSYLNIPDTSDRDSLFQAESRRCKDILNIIDSQTEYSRHFCIFDELYSGTNPLEASKSAYAFLLYLSKHENVDFMITTHYKIICKKLAKKTNPSLRTGESLNIKKRIRNYQTDVIQDKDGNIIYKYKIKPGICNIQGAIEVLKKMNYPKDIIDNYLDF